MSVCLTVLGASATSLSMGSKTLASGATSVTACGSPSAWGVSFTQGGTGNVNVTGAIVSKIESGCSGRTLFITVADSTGAALGNGSVTINFSGNCGASAPFTCPIALNAISPATSISATSVANYAFYETLP